MKITRGRITTYEEEIPKTLGEFRDWEFSSGVTTGEDFKVFTRLYRRYIRSQLSPGMELVKFSPNHYCLSGFISREGRFIYFSISDVRHFPREWINHILPQLDEEYKEEPLHQANAAFPIKYHFR